MPPGPVTPDAPIMRVYTKSSAMRSAHRLAPEYPDNYSLTEAETAILRDRAPAMEKYAMPFALDSHKEAAAYLARIVRTGRGMLVIDQLALVSAYGREDGQHRTVSTVQDFPYVCVSARERSKNLCMIVEGGLNTCAIPLLDGSRVEEIALPSLFGVRLFGHGSSRFYGGLDIARADDAGIFWLPE